MQIGEGPLFGGDGVPVFYSLMVRFALPVITNAVPPVDFEPVPGTGNVDFYKCFNHTGENHLDEQRYRKPASRPTASNVDPPEGWRVSLLAEALRQAGVTRNQ